MAHFEQHCKDCELILGNRFEHVNRWIDELFATHGPKHRRFRHCWHGVRKAQEVWGRDGAKAAIVHIVRDCGAVPHERDYDATNVVGIVIPPEFLMYDGADQAAREKFFAAVNVEFDKFDGKIPK